MLEKWPFLDQKPWVNPFGKISIFRLSELLVFIAQKGVFLFQNIIKNIFLDYIAQKKRWKNLSFLYQIHGLPFWKNLNFSTLKTCCFYSLKNHFFVLQCHKKHFPGLYCLKKKGGNMAIFGPKQVNPFGKMSIFRVSELLAFIGQKGVFSSRIS